ncbi:hypothetical protein ASF72_18045 [Arthrobacter sp. Leaf141]|uniref:hypothetical protein n=1 Tax=Arthrobacter sp. Leaf141 TaxID=1736273 RepID=UPI0006FD20BE|nr:hypothetical protein [Arthrobacter sp. Leaf141]KQQ99056.1 hypothetical protein ASF72_18045 [Arthrobacter sp. Leaf141]
MPLNLAPAPGGRRGSFRVALRMARRDIRRHRGRSVLIVLLILLPVAAMTGAATLNQSLHRTPDETVRYELGGMQARFSTLPAPNGDSVQDPLDDTRVVSSSGAHDPGFVGSDPLDLVPAGYEVVPHRQLQLTTRVGDGDASFGARVVDALHPAFAGRYSLLSGRAPQSPAEVLASPGFLDRFGLEPGTTITTSAGTFTPVGILRDADTSDGNSFLYLAADQVPAGLLAGVAADSVTTSYYLAGPEPVTWQQVRAANRAGVAVLSRDVVLNPPPADQQTFDGGPLPDQGLAAELGMYATFALIGALALLEVGLLAGTAFAVGAKGQIRELALLAASGAEAPTLRAVVTAAGLWLGGTAVVLGAALGFGAAALVVLWVRAAGSARLAGVHPDPVPTAVAMVMGLAACLLAARSPAHHVARRAVLGALKTGRAPAGSAKKSAITGAALLLAAAGAFAGSWFVGHSTSDPDRLAELFPVASGLLTGGAVLTVVALSLLTGWLLTLLPRRTGRLPLALRLAARDATRNRNRTVPAVAAVLAAAALASSALVLAASQQAGIRETYSWTALENQAFLPLSLEQPPLVDGTPQPATAVAPEQLSAALSGALGTVAWTRVVATPAPPLNCFDGPGEDLAPARTATRNCLQYALGTPPGNACPVTPMGRLQDPGDPRCKGPLAEGTGSPRSIVVGGADEIRAVLGVEPGPAALAVLANGGMVVTNQVFVRDGTVELQTLDLRRPMDEPAGRQMQYDPVGSVPLVAAVVEPLVPVPYYGVISAGTAARLGMEPRPSELLVQLTEHPSAAQVDTANGVIASTYKHPGAALWVEPGIPRDSSWQMWAIVLASALITVSAAGITTGLALADGRRDQRTLAAVGAAPRLCKALAGSQALFTAGLGAALGAAAGVVPAVLLVAATEMRIALAVPWTYLLVLVLAVPLVAAALAWTFTRAALPTGRREQGT